MSTTHAPVSAPSTASAAAPHAPSGIRRAARLFNPLIMRLAGTRWFPLYGILEHRGRRSGRVFRTPVVARPQGDGFIVPMPWGEGTDWFRNVRAAGGCRLRWNGRVYDLRDPQVVDMAEAGATFGPFARAFASRFHIRQAVRLHAAESPATRPAEAR
jgi:deazaflavin-dependent oxidoreductase (nitroreductase family)